MKIVIKILRGLFKYHNNYIKFIHRQAIRESFESSPYLSVQYEFKKVCNDNMFMTYNIFFFFLHSIIHVYF